MKLPHNAMKYAAYGMGVLALAGAAYFVFPIVMSYVSQEQATKAANAQAAAQVEQENEAQEQAFISNLYANEAGGNAVSLTNGGSASVPLSASTLVTPTSGIAVNTSPLVQ